MAAPTYNPLGLVEEAYRQHFEVAPARASVSYVGVESMEILRYDSHAEDSSIGITYYASLGMSRYPMTDASEQLVDEVSGPRAELLIGVRGRSDELWRQLAVLAAAPVVEGVVYEVGNRVDLGQPLVAGSRCIGVVVAKGPMQPIATGMAADVQVLKLIPATANELAWARVHGTARLTERWSSAAIDLADLTRDPVALD